MSEYFLADRKAAERARGRKRQQESKGGESQRAQGAQDIKVTLLGDFLFPSSEPRGCDPYNSAHGKSVREAWQLRRSR